MANTLIHFSVAGIPKPQPRHRTSVRLVGGRVFRHNYTPDTVKEWRSCIAAEAIKHRPESPFVGPIRVLIMFWMPIPKSLPKTHDRHHTKKPDIDNLVKAVLDEITTVGGYWKDDAQIASICIEKRYRQTPGASITIRSLHVDKILIVDIIGAIMDKTLTFSDTHLQALVDVVLVANVIANKAGTIKSHLELGGDRETAKQIDDLVACVNRLRDVAVKHG